MSTASIKNEFLGVTPNHSRDPVDNDMTAPGNLAAPSISPRTFLTSATAMGASGLLDRRANAANIASAYAAPDGGQLSQPVLFVDGDWDAICDINRSRLGDPMRAARKDLSIVNVPAGHWLPLERKAELGEAIRLLMRAEA